MTKFTKTDFVTSGDYVFYSPTGSERKFVARFKHRGPFTKAKFLKELIANHSVENYFSAMDAGNAPLAILRDANEKWYYNVIETYYGRPIKELLASYSHNKEELP
jgi:hypothetical protein